MTRFLIPAVAALTLGGCGGPPATPDGGTALASAAEVEMQPGLWSADVTSPAGNRTVETCVTAADVADAKFLAGEVDDATCRVARRRVSGGRIDIDMTCGSGGEATRMRFAGRYSATTYGLETVMTTGGIRYQTNAAGRRVAPSCSASRR